MKKILKKEVIIAFIIGIILASSIAVYAYSCYAKDISYTKPGTETEISVEQALNELYSLRASNINLISSNTTNFGNEVGTITKTYTTESDYKKLLIICTASSGDNAAGAKAETITLTANKSCSITKIDEANQYSNKGSNYSNAARTAVYLVQNVTSNTTFTMSSVQQYSVSQTIQVFSII